MDDLQQTDPTGALAGFRASNRDEYRDFLDGKTGRKVAKDNMLLRTSAYARSNVKKGITSLRNESAESQGFDVENDTPVPLHYARNNLQGKY